MASNAGVGFKMLFPTGQVFLNKHDTYRGYVFDALKGLSTQAHLVYSRGMHTCFSFFFPLTVVKVPFWNSSAGPVAV